MWIVSQNLISNILSNLRIYIGSKRFLIWNCIFVPLFLFFLFLKLLDSFSCFLTDHRFGIRIPGNTTKNIIFFFFSILILIILSRIFNNPWLIDCWIGFYLFYSSFELFEHLINLLILHVIFNFLLIEEIYQLIDLFIILRIWTYVYVPSSLGLSLSLGLRRLRLVTCSSFIIFSFWLFDKNTCLFEYLSSLDAFLFDFLKSLNLLLFLFFYLFVLIDNFLLKLLKPNLMIIQSGEVSWMKKQILFLVLSS